MFHTVTVRGAKKRFELRPNHVLFVRNKRGKPYTVPLKEVARGVREGLLADESVKEQNSRHGRRLLVLDRRGSGGET